MNGILLAFVDKNFERFFHRWHETIITATATTTATKTARATATTVSASSDSKKVKEKRKSLNPLLFKVKF